jgi:hypothetical protein
MNLKYKVDFFGHQKHEQMAVRIIFIELWSKSALEILFIRIATPT